VLLGALGLGLAGCGGPVRAVRVDRAEALRDLNRSVVTSGEPSWFTRDVLFERGLFATFADRPDVAIGALHREMVGAGGDRDLLFALAELSFLRGEARESTGDRLAAAVYAYAFLFPEEGAPPIDALDPRARLAADLYNWSLTAAFASEDGSEVVPRGGTFPLPFGSITVAFDPTGLRAGNRELYGFIPVAELEVKGLAMRYRWPGIGAPLAAATRPRADAPSATDMVAPRLKVPATALLRIARPREALVAAEPLSGVLELYTAWDEEAVTIAGQRVALESQPTAAIAATFTGLPVRQIELLGYLGRLSGLWADRPPLVSTSPYRPGLVPAVFVHGTASSIVRWAEMFNRLQADRDLRSRYQFWFFQYDSDNPIALSALRLREALAAAVARLDPGGTDPALRRMVLIGHSQGGLLVKMQSISTGDRLWSGVSRKPLAELRLGETTRDLLRRGMFLEPLPAVSRVVFVSTPHRGSFVAGYRIVTRLARRLTVLPLQLTPLWADIARNLDTLRTPFVPTATDNMSPRHPFIRALQEIPVAPSIAAHSIISVDGDGPPEEGDDGVVAYASAHIEGVASERIVRSPHSCQANPNTIEEVRRILRLHAGLDTDPGPVTP
jgi:hypothetical protein